MPDVYVTNNEAGDYFVGIEVDGTFIPFATLPATKIGHATERAKNLSELAGSDDPEAVKRHDEAAASLPYSRKTTEPKGGKS